jgi:hypothetical protein
MLSTGSQLFAYDQYGKPAVPLKEPVYTHFRPNPEYLERFGNGTLDFRKWATKADAVIPGEVMFSLYTTVIKANREPSLRVEDIGQTLGYAEDVSMYCPDKHVIDWKRCGKVEVLCFAMARRLAIFSAPPNVSKDQSVCTIDNDPLTRLTYDPDTIDLGSPDATYPSQNAEFCRSSDDKSGKVSNIPPKCPFGSCQKRLLPRAARCVVITSTIACMNTTETEKPLSSHH